MEKLEQQVTVCKTIDQVRETVQRLKREGKRIGLVPTMGALHEGHISLFRHAANHADVVIASIFVNPAQFGPNEDFETYPRRLEEDLDVCRKEGVSIVFAPDRKDIYNGKKFLSIDIELLNKYLCGASRPGFFEGILLIVNKLFNIIRPDCAVFGQKDYQQFKIIEQMVTEFNHPVELVMAPIIRANDGLALSSRNTYLSDEERVLAPGLQRCLQYISDQVKSGVTQPKLLIEHQKAELDAKGFRVDYLGLYSADLLQPVSQLEKGNRYLVAGAAYLGDTRLIDNLLVNL